MRLTTERLILRDFTESDLSTVPASRLTKETPTQPFDLRDPDTIRRTIHHALSAARAEPRVLFDFAITLKQDDTLIGRGGFRRSELEPREALFWFLSDPGSWNNGYVGEAADALFSHCFTELGMHRLFGECDPRNSGAVRLLEKLGMRREAHFIENAWHSGQWSDTAVYALLEREWRARPSGVPFRSTPSGLQ